MPRRSNHRHHQHHHHHHQRRLILFVRIFQIVSTPAWDVIPRGFLPPTPPQLCAISLSPFVVLLIYPAIIEHTHTPHPRTMSHLLSISYLSLPSLSLIISSLCFGSLSLSLYFLFPLSHIIALFLKNTFIFLNQASSSSTSFPPLRHRIHPSPSACYCYRHIHSLTVCYTCWF